ncbi:hypothetical protein GCM10022240_26370 [Microbacterium kribbense]|uniref:Creatinase N-terminal domain-containing protein n=1 Tax=Microbacterium kribbense TaxID=433645 RepID=A0ABP7GQD5_9MICO
MKRGLVVFDHDETSEDEWLQRAQGAQARIVDEGVDLALVYNDVSRGDDIGYLTNLVIYWNEGVLAIPAEGDLTLLTKISPRVFPWMTRNSTLTDLRSGRTIGALVAAYVDGRDPGTIGLIDAELWPTAIVDEIAVAAPDWKIASLGAIVRDQRKIPSTTEVALLTRGAEVLRHALETAAASGLNARERVAALEKVARGGGFADILLRIAEDGEHVTMEASGQYRQGWLQIGRTFGHATLAVALQQAQAAALTLLRSDAVWADVERVALDALDAHGEVNSDAVVSVRWISQADFATGGELQPPPTRGPADGEVAALVIEVVDEVGVRSVLTDTVLVTATGADPLTL